MASQIDVLRTVNSKDYRGCLSTAAHYLSDLASAVGKREAAMFFGMSSDYRKVCKAARRRLCMHNPQMEVKALGSSDDETLPDGVSASIVARVTTNDKDWDGDVVHPDGLVFDQKGPLLWMHAGHMPIGTFAGQVSQDEKSARNKYHLSETQLALDALKLYKIGALRNSIGFKVLEAEPLGFVDGADGKQRPTGFDIKRAVVLENSAVAIPANPNAHVESVYAKQYEALREAYSEKSFRHPIVNKYAAFVYEGRDKVFRGATLEGDTAVEGETVTSKTSTADLEKQVADLTATVEAMKKDATPDAEKSLSMAMEDYMGGSYESSIRSVDRNVKRYLVKEADASEDASPWVVSTFADKAYVCMRKWGGEGVQRKCYEVSYTMGEKGIEFTGHKSVKIEPSIIEDSEKSFTAELVQKASAFGRGGEFPLADGDADTPAVDPNDAARALIAKFITGEAAMDDDTKTLIRQTADLLDKTARLSELSELVSAGA